MAKAGGECSGTSSHFHESGYFWCAHGYQICRNEEVYHYHTRSVS